MCVSHSRAAAHKEAREDPGAEGLNVKAGQCTVPSKSGHSDVSPHIPMLELQYQMLYVSF